MAQKSRTILVTGATGKQGGAVVRHLNERGFAVRALSRDAAKPEARELRNLGVEVVDGDMDDFDSLRRALDGVDGVFGMATPYTHGVEGEIREGNAVIDAAQRAGVNHFVYSSVGSADRNTGIPHFDSKYQIENHLRASGLRYTILRPVFFMENWEGMHEQIEKGTLALPLRPDTRLQMIAVTDIGALATAAFEHPGRWQKREIDIAGDEESMNEIADVFSRVLGRTVRYQQIPWEQFEQRAGHEATLMYRWFDETGYSADVAALRGEHPGLMRFERWARQHAWDRAPV